jgi:hypothetical protein
MIAHGGAVGAAFEALFILVPIAVFAWLSRVSKRRREADEADEAEEAETGTETAGP